MQVLADCIRTAVAAHQEAFKDSTSININYTCGVMRVSCMQISANSSIDTCDYSCRLRGDTCEFFNFSELSEDEQAYMVMQLYGQNVIASEIANILAVPLPTIRNILKKHVLR